MSRFSENKEPTFPSLKNLTSNFGDIPEEQNEFLTSLGAPHIQSFNFASGEGLRRAVNDLDPVEFKSPKGDVISVTIQNVRVRRPCVPTLLGLGSRMREMYPTEARQGVTSYTGKVEGNIHWVVNGEEHIVEKDFGEVPIMVRSSKCNLWKLSPKQLIEKGEHPEEWGGYFIAQGHERLVRMLIMTRRNFPLSMKRSTWKSRGKLFSDLGILIRCVQDDGTSVNNVLHYVTDGTARLMFMLKRSQYFVPVVLILKALLDVSDIYIFKKLMAGQKDNLHFKGCIRSMLQIPHKEGLHTQQQIKEFLGHSFRVKLRELPESWSNVQVCDYILKRCVLIHLSEPEDKFNMLIFMMHKLWALVQDRCIVDGVDSPLGQELLVGGYIWLQYLKERLQQVLYTLRMLLIKESHNPMFTVNKALLTKLSKMAGSVGRSMNNFISTGSVRTQTGLGLMQTTGLTITAENINRMRYMSHFRSVHRGSFFQEMRTTEARQLLPDAWGFICPVHTPDGEPCGLLNHLTKYCEVSPVPDVRVVSKIPSLLVTMGMVPLSSLSASVIDVHECYVVMLDGCILGYITDEDAKTFVQELRILKIEGKLVPEYMEIGFIPKVLDEIKQFPGIFLFTGPARMMRPVINLSCNRVELIGTLEQIWMDICVVQKEAYQGLTTHQELNETSFLSNLACLIPMPDCNQSPRNMYQCQMGKQTMGTATHTMNWITEAKMYRIQTPGTPLFRPAHYDYINLDDFAMGTNAIVAVISYTGYDMEDAMVINKAAHDRGFAHGCVYKSHIETLPTKDSYFGLDPNLDPSNNVHNFLDSDGMPRVASQLECGMPICGYYNSDTSSYVIIKWKGVEKAYIEAVRLCEMMGNPPKRGVCILIRIPRNPSVGDKFASRAGQKGICSMLWPSEDLPFTESGLVPDIVFNPHGFPSRMTIAMMIEIMAGKSAAVHGLVHDATPFRFDENNTAIDYFGRLLEEGGFNYYGTEKMYSGITGEEMNSEIFSGIVYYQRLRHMVADKWQVRSTGPIDMLTHQPVKGRRRGGGVRFGEMERDSLLSHGAAFLLQDRLLHCSDKCSTFVCQMCGNILSPLSTAVKLGRHVRTKVECRICKEKGKVGEMDIPYIYKFLAMQLASVNINLKVEVQEI